ncbi:mitochondrial ATP synthase subunit 5 [Drechslerella stenobrocha 248]|uniref:ATP synthase subunit 5, mitochondrial n=1 Tax=Drechslerella stenobrocha 248 TaxID=1043628 RepID=W7IF27_9PEZI|nr:mitochondrial ATP synthase subunit 5 [Drechslerella stenobrocha 248]
MLSRSTVSIARAAATASPIASRAALLSSVRTYATGAETTTKPPVALYGLDGTYASSLYIASAKTSTLDTVDRSLKSLKQLLDKDPKLVSVISSPTLSATDKSALVTEIHKAVPAAASDKNFKNLLAVLADNNRLGLLGGIADKFAILMGAHRGEVEATITSAQPLDPKAISRLESAISKSKYIQQGQKLKVVNKVNPDVLGGLVVEVGDRTIDLSVSAKIAKLNKLLTDSL